MRLVQKELAAMQSRSSAGAFSVDDKLNEVVWRFFHKAQAAKQLRIKWHFFSIDFSSKLAEKLTEWFGPDPLLAKL